MKRFVITLVILLAICGAFFYALSWPRGLGNELATGGVLDLTNADFTQTRHNLDGEWEFYFGALYTPEDFARGAVSGGTIINVPGSWTDAGHPLYGNATYRLIVKTNEPSLMMFVTTILNASAVWINGESVFSAGTVGEQTVQATGVGNEFISFYPKDGQVEIIVQASNYTWFSSGIVTGMEIGCSRLLLNDAVFRRVLLSVFIGILLAMFLYQLFLFFWGRKEWVHLAFALFCIVTAARFMLETNGLVFLFRDYGHIERSIYQVLMALKTASLVVFTHYAFKITVRKVGLCVHSIVLGIPIFVAIFLPLGTVDSRVAFLPIISLVIMFFTALGSKRLHDNYYNYLYLIVYFFYCIIQPIERFVLDGQFYMLAAAHNLLMVLTQFFMLSQNYSQAMETEQRLAAEKASLENLARIKTDFLNDIKHEVRNPLHIISIGADYTNQCLSKGDMEQEARNMQGVIQDEAIRLGRMIEGMVELATESGESGNLGGLRRQRTDLEELLKTSVQNNRFVLEQKGNTLRQEIQPGLPYVYVDAIQMTRVLQNLFSNAANSTENGNVTLSAKADESYVTVCVSDTGGGIPAELLPDVFKRGVSGKDGKGYGLSICKTIVEAHSGTIEIESKQSKGTSVTFTIPVYGGQSEEVTA